MNYYLDIAENFFKKSTSVEVHCKQEDCLASVMLVIHSLCKTACIVDKQLLVHDKLSVPCLSVNTCGEVRYCMRGRLFQKCFRIFVIIVFALFVLCPSGVVITMYVHTVITEIWQFVQVANYIIIQLLLHMYCACCYVVSCSLTCYFRLPLHQFLTVGLYQLLDRLREANNKKS